MASLVSVAIISQIASYSIPSLASRIFLFITFFALLLLTSLCAIFRYIKQATFGREIIMFAVLLVISFSFLLRRSFYMSPEYVERCSYSEKFLTAQTYNENGFLVFDSSHSYFFLHSLVLHFLNSVCGFTTDWSVYISDSLYVVLIAAIGMFILGETYKRLKGKNLASSLMPSLVSFSFVSFAYSERRELAMPLMLLLLCYLFYTSRIGNERKVTVILVLLVLGITFGSSTSIFMAIPFFLLFSAFRKKATTILYSLIPLSYLIFAAYSYALSLKRYTAFMWEGFVDFFREIMSWQLPERVIPWQRSTIPTVEDMYITSVTYLSIILLSALIAFFAIFIWTKEVRSYKRNDESALSCAASITVLFTLGIVSLAYIGASVKPEVTFSDIRTILIVCIMLLLPFLFVSSKLLAKISANKLLLTLVITLMIVASMRTFYEVYPKSIYDPVNAVEDIRVDPLSVYYVEEFLKDFKIQGVIAFDYKTGLMAPSCLSYGRFQSSIFTSRLTPSTVIVFDMNGLKLGSLYTSPEAYAEAYNLTLTQNIIYNSGNITIIQRK
jgi:hypothetical protein